MLRGIKRGYTRDKRRPSHRAYSGEAGGERQVLYLLAGLAGGPRNAEYPAIFVSDGAIMLTLWAIQETPSNPFDKNKNVGLHHVAFTV